MKSMLSIEDFQSWMPTKVYGADGDSFIDWSYFENIRFTEPFFESSLVFRKRDSAQRPLVRQTPLNFLLELYEKSPGIVPAGFIFHVSRCGSTLVSQMLAATDENIVISEAPLIDAIIRGLHGTVSDREIRTGHLKWLVNAYGQKRFSAEKHLFIKFDCWHMIDLELINAAFPDVPWIFLHRNPVEVIVSHLRRRGIQMIPGAVGNLLPDHKVGAIVQMPAAEYCAMVLKRICESALKHADQANALFINYSELPEAVFTKVFAHFKLNYESGELAKIHAATKRDAKMPQVDFKPDVDHKNAEASDSVKAAAAKYVLPVYEELERIRLNIQKT